MNEISFIYSMVREAGQLAPLVVLYVGWRIAKNDLKHIAKDLKWLKTEFVKHLEDHAKGEL